MTLKYLLTSAFALVLVAMVLLGCSPPASNSEEPAAPETPQVAPIGPAAVNDSTALNATARLLAGLEAPDAHTAAMNAIWQELDEKHLDPMRAWRGEVLDPLAGKASPLAGTPVFYPFGGPNLLNAHTFFPDAPVYVLVGLEPPGPIPVLDGLAGTELTAELERLEGSFGNLVRAGYFVRTQMDNQLVKAEVLEGLLPMMTIFAARTGHQLNEITFIDLADDGIAQPAPEARSGKGGSVRLRLVSEEGDEKLFYYFSQDLSDSGLEARPGFLAFIRGLGRFRTTMKSAEYLLQMDGFQVLRDFLAQESVAVLQDDSGLPLSAMANEPMQLHFFGTYTETLPSYGQWFQQDLADAFAATEQPPLPFNIGYHVDIGGSALILGIRKAP